MNVGAILTGGLGVFGSANLLITLGYHAGEPPAIGDAGEILPAARRTRIPPVAARRRIQLARRPQ